MYTVGAQRAVPLAAFPRRLAAPLPGSGIGYINYELGRRRSEIMDQKGRRQIVLTHWNAGVFRADVVPPNPARTQLWR